MYGLINIYDNVVNGDYSNNTHEIVIIARVFFTCLRIVSFDNNDSDSIQVSKTKYCISTTYNLLYKSNINYDFYIFDIDFSFSLGNSKIESFYTILSEENRKYFNHNITYTEYIINMNSLFQMISKELDNQSEDDLIQAKNFCEYHPFYQKYNEFLNIYSQILQYFKSDDKFEKINENELIKMLEYVLSTIGKKNLALFLSIDIKCLCEVYIPLGCEFTEVMLSRFFDNCYIPFAHNLKSIYFLTEFITAIFQYLGDQTVTEEFFESVI
jgi:hypothetical protein